MKTNLLISLIAAASLALGSLAFAQTAVMTGKVVAVTSSTITVQKGEEVWQIKYGRGTDTTTVSGELKVGSTVTVKYNGPDAQKKEGPAAPTPSDATQ